jgi:hypothetical protein
VLGKIIGVYLGRPFEGWTYERIMDELGEITYYIHEKLDKALDGDTVLAETDFAWEFGGTYEFGLQVAGRHLEASMNGQVLFSVEDTHRPLTGGGVALVCEEGCISSDTVTVQSDNTGAQMEGVKR